MWGCSVSLLLDDGLEQSKVSIVLTVWRLGLYLRNLK